MFPGPAQLSLLVLEHAQLPGGRADHHSNIPFHSVLVDLHCEQWCMNSYVDLSFEGRTLSMRLDQLTTSNVAMAF